MNIKFEFDILKAENNLKKHRISFNETESVFYDDFAKIYNIKKENNMKNLSKNIVNGDGLKINLKQQQLIDELFAKVKEKYPEIILKSLEASPDDPEHIWINVIADMDEDREIEMHSYSAELQIDILMDYGYAISIMPENPSAVLI